MRHEVSTAFNFNYVAEIAKGPFEIDLPVDDRVFNTGDTLVLHDQFTDQRTPLLTIASVDYHSLPLGYVKLRIGKSWLS
jgi:hypothetical protein